MGNTELDTLTNHLKLGFSQICLFSDDNGDTFRYPSMVDCVTVDVNTLFNRLVPVSLNDRASAFKVFGVLLKTDVYEENFISTKNTKVLVKVDENIAHLYHHGDLYTLIHTNDNVIGVSGLYYHCK